jgi:hypothetical protein
MQSAFCVPPRGWLATRSNRVRTADKAVGRLKSLTRRIIRPVSTAFQRCKKGRIASAPRLLELSGRNSGFFDKFALLIEQEGERPGLDCF